MDDPYARLLELRRNEGAVRGLAKLPRDFYTSTTAYLEETRRAFESEVRENPSSRRGDISRQTYQRASQAARDLIEARMSKVLAAAFQASVGGARDLPNALPEERELFEKLAAGLSTFRRAAAPFLEPGSSPPSVVPPSAEPAGVQPSVVTTAASPNPPVNGARPTAAPRLAYVRVLRESRPIQVGRDTIDLRKEDIVALPPETADLLVKGKVAELVRPAGPGPVT